MIIENVDIGLIKRINNLQKFIGNTPLYPIARLFSNPDVQIYAKLEWQQLGGSVKSRPAFNIIKNAVISGELYEGKKLLDATSGNTGIAYAVIGNALGIPVTLCVPENASPDRKKILSALGAEVIYTSKFESTDGAQKAALDLYNKNPEKYYYANQYANDSNWKAHYYHTSQEIYYQTHGKITHFVAGLGTSGTFTGAGRRLKLLDENIKLISLQPDTALHGLEGWKHLETALIPEIFDSTLADVNLEISTVDAYKIIKKAAFKEGLLLSPSSAANLAGAVKVAENIDKGVVVTIFPDNADRYNDILKTLFNS